MQERLKRRMTKMIFKYEDETVDYPTEELHKLKDGETVGIDFNGNYMIEFKKVNAKTLVTTGNGMNGYGSPIKVTKQEIFI